MLKINYKSDILINIVLNINYKNKIYYILYRIKFQFSKFNNLFLIYIYNDRNYILNNNNKKYYF